MTTSKNKKAIMKTSRCLARNKKAIQYNHELVSSFLSISGFNVDVTLSDIFGYLLYEYIINSLSDEEKEDLKILKIEADFLGDHRGSRKIEDINNAMEVHSELMKKAIYNKYL